MRHLITTFVLFASTLALACHDDPEEDRGVGECSDQNPILTIDNQTGNTIEVVQFRACDMSDEYDFPLPPPGLANGETLSIPFPGYGCWKLGYEGDGCQGLNTPEVSLDCGETYEWTPDEYNHGCIGG